MEKRKGNDKANMFILQQDGDKVYVTGPTFPIKDKLRAAGGKWDGERKAWFVAPEKTAQVAQMIAHTQGKHICHNCGDYVHSGTRCSESGLVHN